jgi:hypothetical protein
MNACAPGQISREEPRKKNEECAMSSHRGGTFMMERPADTAPKVRPKSSENDPPAANQPMHDGEAARPTRSDTPPADRAQPEPAPEIVPGKPDGEVDTRN